MINAQHISYKIGRKTLLDGVSLTVKPGELVAVVGANGAGKSTLLNTLSRDLTPSAGTIQLNGVPLSHYSARELALRRAVLTQQNALNFPFSVYELVMMGRYPHFDGHPTANDRAIIDYVLDQTGITHLVERTVLSLSGGEQQRVHLAKVMAQLISANEGPSSTTTLQTPKYLLLDEPTTGLDLYYQHALLDIAKDLSRRGYGVVAILHDLNLVMQYADQVLLLKNGYALDFGPPAAVLTSALIHQTFGLRVDVLDQPTLAYPIIIPTRHLNPYQTILTI